MTADQLPGALRRIGGGAAARRKSVGSRDVMILLLPSMLTRTPTLLRAPLATARPTAPRRLYAAVAYGLRTHKAEVCVSGFPLATGSADTYTDVQGRTTCASQRLLPTWFDDALVASGMTRGEWSGTTSGVWAEGDREVGADAEMEGAGTRAPLLRALTSAPTPPCSTLGPRTCWTLPRTTAPSTLAKSHVAAPLRRATAHMAMAAHGQPATRAMVDRDGASRDLDTVVVAVDMTSDASSVAPAPPDAVAARRVVTSSRAPALAPADVTTAASLQLAPPIGCWHAHRSAHGTVGNSTPQE